MSLTTLRDDGPPVWICDVCHFEVTKMLLRASDGAVGPDRREVQDICPNDGTSLRRLTWKEDAQRADRVAIEQMKRADAAEAKLEQPCEGCRRVQQALGELETSLRSRLLFGNFDEPIDDAGVRLIRVILTKFAAVEEK